MQHHRRPTPPKAMNSNTQTLNNDSTACRSSIRQPQTSENIQVVVALGEEPKAMIYNAQTLNDDSTVRRLSILQPQTSEHAVQVGEAHGKKDFPFVLVPPCRLEQPEDSNASTSLKLKPRPTIPSFESFSSSDPFYQEPADHTLITDTRFFVTPKISPKSPRALESMFGEKTADSRETM